MSIRPAVAADDGALARLERACWSVRTYVLPLSPADAPFFSPSTQPDDVLVAVTRAAPAVVGWLKLVPPTPLSSNAHVQQVQGLAVDPAQRGAGIARALLAAAEELARQRGARKISLRVLSTNDTARRLYDTAGFRLEGVLVAEFFLGGEYVDDLLMARALEAQDDK